MKCRACEAMHLSPEHRLPCQRMHSKVRQWWEREPGWFRREFKAQGPTEWWPRIGRDFTGGFRLYRATQAQLVAELARQSQRLSKQPAID